MFSNRGFETLFPHTETSGCVVYLAPQVFLTVYLQVNVGLPSPQSAASVGPQATALSPVLSPPGCPSPPLLPTGLDECFFFNSLVVELPYSFDFLSVLVIFYF